MVERVAALPGGFDEDADLVLDRRLADEVVEGAGPQRRVGDALRLELVGADHALVGHRAGTRGVEPAKRRTHQVGDVVSVAVDGDRSDRVARFGLAEPETDQPGDRSRDRLVLACRGGVMRPRRLERADLVAQLEDHALRGLASDARDGRHQRDVALGDGADQGRKLRTSKDAERRLRTDALDADQQAEQAQLVAGDEAVEADRVRADARVHVQGHLRLARRVQRRNRAQVAEHLVADAAGVDDDVVVTDACRAGRG